MSTLFEQVDKFSQECPTLDEALRVWDEIVPAYVETMQILRVYELRRCIARVYVSDSTAKEQEKEPRQTFVSA